MAQDVETSGDLGSRSVAIIIPHYNDVKRLGLCLKTLHEGDDPELLARSEIVVADNNSSDDLSAVKAAFPGVRFLTETARGAAAARNAGVAATKGDLLFFVDADCVPAADWLRTGYEAIQNAELVGGRVETFDETPAPRSGAEAFESVFAFDQHDYITRKHFSVTANLLTWRRIFEDVGGFHDGVSEDRDWCLRARDKGYRLVYEERLLVMHPTRSDWPALEKKWRRLVNESFLLNGSGLGARLRWLARAPIVVASALFHLPKVALSPKLASTAERARAIATLLRLRAVRGYWMAVQAFSAKTIK